MGKDKENSKQKQENSLSAALRAISGQREATLSVRDGNNTESVLIGKSLTIPSRFNNMQGQERSLARGMADSAGLWMRYHNAKLHKQLTPESSEAKLTFNAAERARVQALGINSMPGMAGNINAEVVNAIKSKSLDLILSPQETSCEVPSPTGRGVGRESLTNSKNENPHPDSLPTFEGKVGEIRPLPEGEVIPLPEIIAMLVRQRIAGLAPPPEAEGLMQKWGYLIQAKSAKHIARLDKLASNQEGFAREINAMLEDLQSSGSEEKPEEEEEFNEDNSEQQEQEKPDNTPEDDGDAMPVAMDGKESKGGEQDASKSEQTTTVQKEELAADSRNEWEDNNEDLSYKIYTNEFDQIIKAEDLCEIDELRHLRAQLDLKLAKLKGISRRQVNNFIRKLTSYQRRHWEHNLEDGIIDTARLPILIANPNYLEYHKREKEARNIDTVVTLLMDNSGSMRGRPITVAAMSAEILAKTLESVGIKVEILGFTTAEWKGGKSRKKWQENGGYTNPGRLNDLRHIIYKPADMAWKRARRNLGLMLKEGILKENIDGEAVLWAYNRLAMRPEKRRILMVISDGAPVDDSTISANSPAYLDNHLRDVIQLLEARPNVELVAIGIGHDVTRYYSHAVTIREVEELGNTMFSELAQMFSVA